MNKQDLAWFIKDNLDYTFESANEEYPAEVHIDYDALAEKLQEEFYTAEEVRIICLKLRDFIASPKCNGGSDIEDWIRYIDKSKVIQEHSKIIAANAVREFAEKLKISIQEDENLYQQAEDCGLYPEDLVLKVDELLEKYDK